MTRGGTLADYDAMIRFEDELTGGQYLTKPGIGLLPGPVAPER